MAGSCQLHHKDLSWSLFLTPAGLTCRSQDFKGIAKQLEVGAMVKFTPHYLIWVCQFSSDAEECKTQCIRQGAYCCPDPDDNIYEGYSGRDVLLVSIGVVGTPQLQQCHVTQPGM
jgi:hypothetical protein